MVNISASELKPEYNIIDIRRKSEYLKGHIYSAKNVYMDNLIDMPYMYLDKEKLYYIYCGTGQMSKKCCKMLELQGYNVINVYDGYEKFNK